MIKIVVLLSGSGSTFQAILDRCKREPGIIEIAAVISNKLDAYGLVRAQQAGIQTAVLEPRHFQDQVAYHHALQKRIDSYLTSSQDLIVLAGYMRVLNADFVRHFENRILNLHPSLLPKFPGLQTHTRAIEAGEKEHGCTIHKVIAELDAGPIIAQAKVAISLDDTPASLEEKVRVLERQLYPDVLFEMAKGIQPSPPPVKGELEGVHYTYFISDLHLSEDRPAMIRCFLNFLEHKAFQAEALYILGDFFDFWIGDDNKTLLSTRIASALKTLSLKGVKIYFMAGNRDFLLGKKYADSCGMTILSDPTLIHLYDASVLLMHGDLLCTDDLDYQAFRRQVAKPWIRTLFLSLPLFVRRYFAELGRQKVEDIRRQ